MTSNDYKIMKDLETLVKQFFELSEITVDEISMEEQESGIFKITLKTPDSGIVIGPHGKNMPIFSNILKLLLSKKLDARVKVHFDVNDYGKQKQEQFFQFIESKIKYVGESGKDLKLPFLTAYERKKVHSFISEREGDSIFTKSIWEWNDRRLFICKKSDTSELIDIDWIDI